jgi:uncharacterized protein YfdQ (DUF2303 family)
MSDYRRPITDLSSEIVDTTDTVRTVVELTQRAMTPVKLAPGAIYAVATADGKVHTIDLTADQYLANPRRPYGIYHLRDTESWLAVWAKWYQTSIAQPEVFADVDNLQVVAVFDPAPAEETDSGLQGGWRQHRAQLQLRKSDALMRWTALQGRTTPIGQVDFADFLEDNLVDIVEPDAARVLEVVSTLHATSRVTFKSGIRLTDGQRQLTWVESTTAAGGTSGNLEMPPTITLGLPVFEGSKVRDRITARMRYRINDGKLTFTVRLDRIDDVIANAFEDQVAAIAKKLETHPILRGTAH